MNFNQLRIKTSEKLNSEDGIEIKYETFEKMLEKLGKTLNQYNTKKLNEEEKNKIEKMKNIITKLNLKKEIDEEYDEEIINTIQEYLVDIYILEREAWK